MASTSAFQAENASSILVYRSNCVQSLRFTFVHIKNLKRCCAIPSINRVAIAEAWQSLAYCNGPENRRV